MTICENKVDLYQLALDAGMTQEEYIKAVAKDYFAQMSLVIEQNGGKPVLHRLSFIDHDIEIIGRRIGASNATIN